MKKIFTFLVAFLTTLSGAVWGQLGTSTNYYDISQLQKVLEIDDSEEYYLTGSNNYGILVKAGGSSIEIGGDKRNKPHIYLKNVSFGSVNAPMGGSAIIIENRTEVTISIEGENSIVSNGTSDAAIKLESGEGLNTAELIFDGTGHLDINMLGSSSVNQVAIGERGVGLDALHNCGSLTINGGTITTNGYIGEFHSHAFRMNGNGIVVAKDIVTSDIHENWLVDSGIYYETEEGQDALNVVGNVTINSPIPDGNIYIGAGNSLTLGEGDVLDESRVKIDGGTLNAYKVSYDLNKPADMTSVTPGIVNSKYYGPNTALEEITPTIDPETSYYYWGWANNASLINKTGQETPTGISNIDAKAVWVVQNKTITAKEGAAISDFYLVSPQTVTGIEFALAEGTNLPNAITNTNNKISGTLNASGTTKYTASDDATSKTVTLTFNVVKDPIDLEGNDDEGNALYEIRGVVDLVYNGQEQKETQTKNLQVYDVKAGINLADENYTVSYGDASVKDVGQYTVTVTGTGAYSGTLFANFNITKADATVTAENVEWTIGEGTGPDFSKALTAKGVGSDQLTATYTSTEPSSWTEAGVYNVTYKGIKLNNDLAGNYKEVADVTGKLTVKVDGNTTPIDPNPGDGEDPIIKPGTDDDTDGWTWNGEAWERRYDGEPHGFESITITYNDATATGGTTTEVLTEDDGEITVDYTTDEAGTEKVTEVKNANTYYAHINIVKTDGGVFSGEVEPIKLVITCRPLRVDFDLTNLDESAIGATLDAQDYASYDNNGENEGLVPGEYPIVEGTFQIAGTPNDNGKYDIKAEGVKLSNSGEFLSSNYETKYFVNGQQLDDNDGNGDSEGEIGGEDGVDIDEGNTGSGINTRRYQLYLANKDYNVKDAKEDYAAEGLELFSRHNKKYTNAGGSFTVWYEKDGVANAGGYRIFWSNRANGDYKEVKFDTVSEYFQIRNVQSNVYVKIYAADGFPVGNEEISAADYRAYAQPNKIVVITPQPTDVQIISMAGAVVATDKVTGQREFANLTEGVYIVRMGETVVKLQVRK